MNDNSSKYGKNFRRACRSFVALACAASLAAYCADISSAATGADPGRDAAANSGRGARRAAHSENRHKSGFISKLDKMIKSGEAITAERFERLKKEIIKLRERMNKRAEQIDRKIMELTTERARIKDLLTDLATAEVEFHKIKVYSGENSGEIETAAPKPASSEDHR